MPDFPMIDADGHVVEHTMQIIEHMQPPYNDPHPYRTQGGALFPSLDGWPRVGGLATLPVQDPEEAAKELRRAVTELGFVGGLLPAGNALLKSFSHPDFDPLLGEAERLGVPLALHGAPSRGFGFDYFDSFIKVHTL